MEGKLKILEIKQKSEEILQIYLIFCAFGDFLSMFCGDVLKRGVPKFPDVHIFGTDQSLVMTFCPCFAGMF